MTELIEKNQQECPNCQVILPVHPGYVTWCDQCEWNLNPLIPEEPPNIFEKAYAVVGQRQSQVLLDHFIKAEALAPTLSASKFFAIIIAAFIHGLTLAFVIGGITLLIKGWPNILAIVSGFVFLGIAWVLRPRFAKSPSTVVSRSNVPTLYKLVEVVACSLDSPNVNEISVDGKFGASFWKVGLQHKGVICLGLPLWSILTNPEKIALIAHELAHGINGDVTRGRFIGTAIGALLNWFRLLHPIHIWAPGSGISGLLMFPFKLVLFSLSQFAVLGARVLSHLLWRNKQRAEYLADHLASNVAGTDAMLSLLENIHLRDAFQVTLRRVALSDDKSIDFFKELREKVDELPLRELERIKRVQQLELSRLNVTHPPNMNRIKLLKSRIVHHPKIEFPLKDFEKLEGELSLLRGDIQQKLKNMYLASLYR